MRERRRVTVAKAEVRMDMEELEGEFRRTVDDETLGLGFTRFIFYTDGNQGETRKFYDTDEPEKPNPSSVRFSRINPFCLHVRGGHAVQ